MKEIIKKSFELWVRSLWLKEIDKICEKIKKLDSESARQRIVLNEMIKKYKEKYPNALTEMRENHEN